MDEDKPRPGGRIYSATEMWIFGFLIYLITTWSLAYDKPAHHIGIGLIIFGVLNWIYTKYGTK